MEKDAFQIDNKLSPRDVKEMIEDLKVSDLDHIVLKYQIDEDSIKNYVRESPSAKELSWVIEDEIKTTKTAKNKKNKTYKTRVVEGGYISKQHPKFIIQDINLDDFNLSDNSADFLINNKLYVGEN